MLTELDIINDMLAATGTAPLTTSDTRHPSYLKASNTLNRVSGAVQNLGLWFNTTHPELLPNTSGEVVVPNGTLSADPVDRTNDYSFRGARLFDLKRRTFNIGKPVTVKLVSKLAVPDMPNTALEYIRAKAKLEFYLDEDGTDPKLTRYTQFMQLAWTELYREHLRNRDTNYFDGPNMARYYSRGTGPTRLPGPRE
tara:strand:+ start:17218 stop:17805 length:588 start_codon:yes stop_codon:yes gene_type:complete